MSKSAEIFIYWQNWLMCIVFNYSLFCLILGRFISVTAAPPAPQVEESDPYALFYPSLR